VFPITVDVADVLEGYKTLGKLATAPKRIIPGHDPLVLKYYPPLNSQTQGIVHRLDVLRTDG
jgi:hypothetical protein